ncbi:hypothetical protein NDU88_009490 [Pleurodeles waltl]|uniref:NACHT, LRR and PYD domains-containing protein 3 n=1 Tax=Pleurodeles waltl TaxID=8319 RepID=A0AAV7P0W5_PLEWA|nr:hypothetical protein NDU88_009490 [Pleurodeles waltl]
MASKSSPETARDVIHHCLEDLIDKKFKEFKIRLQDYTVKPGQKTIPRSRLENVDRIHTAITIIEHYGEETAFEITQHVLEKIPDLHLLEKLKTSIQSYYSKNSKLSAADVADHNTKYKEYIKNEFRRMKDNDSTIGDQVILEERYTKLLILKNYRDKENKCHEIISRGQRHLELIAERAAQSYPSIKDLFRPEKDGHVPRTVVLQGVAGIGKTVTARKIMLDWASGNLFQESFEFVFYIHCREYNQLSAERPLAELIIPRIDGEPLLSISEIEADPKKLLFIIDGFDELKITGGLKTVDPDREFPEGKTIFSLIRKRYLWKSYIIITTRPTALDALQRCVKDERLAEILGFCEAGRIEYFTKFFGDEGQGADAIRLVKENEVLYTMCFVPIVCWIVCTVIQQNKNNRDSLYDMRTITSVYLLFLLNLLKQQSTDSERENITNDLKRLSALAEEGVPQQKILFEEDDLVKHGVDMLALKSLFLNNLIFKEYTTTVSVYSFIHLSFQEFFAALFYILEGNSAETRSPQQCDVTTLLREYTDLDNNHWMLTVRFLFGLINEERLERMKRRFHWKVSPEIKATLLEWITERLKQEEVELTSRTMELFHCLYETQDEEFVKRATRDLKRISLSTNTTLYGDKTMDSMDFRALAFCLKNSDVQNIDLQMTKIRPEDVTILISGLTRCSRLRLIQCFLTGPCCEDLVSVLKTNTSLTELDLGGNALGDSGVKKLCEGLKHPNCKLQKLRLGGCSLTGSCYEDLTSSLKTNTTLTLLDLNANKLTDFGVKKLCEGLKHPNCKLQKLGLSICSLTGPCCKDLASALKTNTSLTELDLGPNELRNSGVKKLCEGLKHPNCKLQKLRLGGCSLTGSCCEALASALKTNTSLTELDLSPNALGDSGVKKLCEGLKHPNCKLQILW